MTKTTVSHATERARHAVATATQAPAGDESSSRATFATTARRVATYGIAVCGLAALQLASAGPAAVATRPTDEAPRERVRPFAAAMLPAAPGFLANLLDDAFPSIRVALPPAFEPLPPQQTTATNPDEIIDFGAKRAPRWLVESLLKAAQVTGVDPVYLMTLADVESSLEPRAKAPTSSAAGLFQFIDSTWLEVLHDHGAEYGYRAAAAAVKNVDDEWTVADESQRAWVLGLKRDPYLSALMAGELIKDIQRELRNVGERELAETELYIAHFFGAKTAIEFLKVLDEKPDAVAAHRWPKAAKANMGLFAERSGRKRRLVTVSELYDKIDSKIERRLNRYDPVALWKAPQARSAVADALSFAPN